MPQDVLDSLRTIDPVVLQEVVRQERGNAAFEITEWSVDRLSSKGMINPDGLFLFKGKGRDGRGTEDEAWSVVLKILRSPGEEQDPRDLWYWKRELLAFQSGLTTNLPDNTVAAPRFYGMAEYDDSAWLWMEHIQAEPDPWTVADYTHAAHQIGRLNGAYVTGTPLPDFPWLCKDHNRSWIRSFPPFEQAWENPVVKATFPTSIQERIIKLGEEREQFLDVLNRLPQTFSHFDFQRRNLFLRSQNDQRTIVAVDWAQCGYGALGTELSYLLAGSTLLFEMEPDEIAELEPLVFEAYLTGLREMGWSGNSEIVRLGYTAHAATLVGIVLPSGVAIWTSEAMREQLEKQIGRPSEVVSANLRALCEHGLNCADEARLLMDRLL